MRRNARTVRPFSIASRVCSGPPDRATKPRTIPAHPSVTKETDLAKQGTATDFEITVNDIEIGAGFVVPILGKMMRMPGLPEAPASDNMDIDAKGMVTGLS